MAISNWMSWVDGVDLCAATDSDLQTPNLLLHLASQVYTPEGAAPAGIVLWQPDPNAAPLVFGFVCNDPKVGAFFGPKIFAGTPFENAPVLEAQLEVTIDAPHRVSARLEVGGHVFESLLEGLGELEVAHRDPMESAPFVQQSLESNAHAATLRVDGREVPIALPVTGPTGGPAAIWSPAGLYAR